jgi:hypothetical protein
MTESGETVETFERMVRPSGSNDFADWLVPARNNIQREMLRLRPLMVFPSLAGIPNWIFRSRRLAVGASFSLWRSVFQTRRFWPNPDMVTEGRKFLDEIIHNNAASYATELNAWSLEYYIENAVYRLRHARDLALDAGIDPSRLPIAPMLGESINDIDILTASPFTPYGEWEECFHATRALISVMKEVVGGPLASGG